MLLVVVIGSMRRRWGGLHGSSTGLFTSTALKYWFPVRSTVLKYYARSTLVQHRRMEDRSHDRTLNMGGLGFRNEHIQHEGFNTSNHWGGGCHVKHLGFDKRKRE
jgi:hypothetical protein